MSENPGVARLIEVLLERTRPIGTPVQVLRRDMEDAVARMPIDERVTITAARVGGRSAEWIAPPFLNRQEVLVWFHGGGYVMGSPATVRPMATILSACLGGRVLTPDYRLAPEHPFPAAILDGVAVYEDLIEDGTAPGAIAFGGDSAGGGLVLAILLAIRERGLPLPSAAVCVSPWVDLTTSGLDALDPQVTSGRLEEMAGWYIGSADPGDPLASPLRADLTGLPPLLIQVGGSERLALDGERLAEVARKGGVEVSFESWADMIHVWHAFAPRLEEGTSALRMIARWLVERWNQRAGE